MAPRSPKESRTRGMSFIVGLLLIRSSWVPSSMVMWRVVCTKFQANSGSTSSLAEYRCGFWQPPHTPIVNIKRPLSASVPKRVRIPPKPGALHLIRKFSSPGLGHPLLGAALHSYQGKGDHLSTRPPSKRRCTLDLELENIWMKRD